MRTGRLRVLWIPLALTGLAACGSNGNGDIEPGSDTNPPSTDQEMAAPGHEESIATVRITAPGEGSEVEGPDIVVVLDIGGMEIKPAGDMTPNSGHHHLYLDHDLTDPSQPIPAIPGSVIHMGDGSAEFVFEGVEPGEHRIIAVVGDHIHMPLQPWVVDTVFFTVR